MKKILHVTPEIGEMTGGGIGSVCNMLYKYKKDTDLFLFCDLWYENTPKQDYLSKLPADVKSCSTRGIADAVAKYNVDTVIFHAMYLFRAYVENLKTKKHDNCWVVLHNNAIIEDSYLNTSFEHLSSYEFVYAVYNANTVSISNYEKGLLNVLNEAKVIDKENVVIYNGGEMDGNFRYVEGDKTSYGYLGRLEERKGVFHLCQQFKNIDRKLLLATGNSKKVMMTMLSMSIDGNSNIVPLGWCVKDRLNSFFKTISALIVPSIYEPFGMIYLEAGNALVPIISNRTPSAVEILGEDYPLFFDVLDKTSLKSVISLFESMSFEEKEKLVIETKKRMTELFSAESMVKNYRNL